MWCCEQPTRIVGARKASRRSATARLSSSPSIESVPIGMWWPCCSTAPKAITIVSRPASSSRRMSGHVSVYRSSAPTAASRGCLGGRLQTGAKHRHAGRLRAASSRLRADHDLLGPVQPGDAGGAGSAAHRPLTCSAPAETARDAVRVVQVVPAHRAGRTRSRVATLPPLYHLYSSTKSLIGFPFSSLASTIWRPSS